MVWKIYIHHVIVTRTKVLIIKQFCSIFDISNNIQISLVKMSKCFLVMVYILNFSSVNGSAVLPGERTGSGLPPPEAVNIQPPDQTKTISTMPNFVQSQVVKSDVTLQQRPNSPFTLRQRPNSPSTLRQRPVSPSAQRQRPVSPSTLRHRPISPKLSANFTSPIKIYPIHNNKTEGFCQGNTRNYLEIWKHFKKVKIINL